MKHLYSCIGLSSLALGSLLARPAAAQNQLRLDPSFQLPQILAASTGTAVGTVRAVVRQPDGRYVIGGSFGRINGVRARNLARLNADGTLDAAFTAACAANRTVSSLALQPDGSILAVGQFDSLANVPRQYIGRVLPGGTVDAAFAPVVPVSDYVSQVAILPGGDVLSLAPSAPSYGVTPTGLRRFNGVTGQSVPGFAPAVDAVCLAVQPDGKILIGGSAPPYVFTYMLARLLPNGSLDPGFAHRTNAFVSFISQVGYAGDGAIYMAGNWNGGQLLRAEFIGPQGSLGTGGLANAYSFAFQPNGRVLLAGTAAATGALTARLLPNGQPDNSYLAANGPRATATGQNRVQAMLVQPDGALLMAGSFTQAGTTPTFGLARFLDGNVLAAKSAAELTTAVWPLPANEILRVALVAAAKPQQVQLFDGLGRRVHTQAVAAGASEISLAVAALPAGVYVLRVGYAQGGSVVYRVVLAR